MLARRQGRSSVLMARRVVHRAVALRDLGEGQGQVEHLAGIDLPVPHQVDEVRQVTAHGGGAAVQVDVPKNSSSPVELDAVRDADVTDRATGARRLDRLHHRFLRADAFEDAVGADALRQLLDAGDAVVAALGDDVGRAELAREPLPRLVAAHRDDALGAHLSGGQDREQADRAVTDDGDRLARLDVGRVGGEPAGAHHVGERQQAGDQIVRRNLRASPTSVPSASGTRSTRRLRADDQLAVLARSSGTRPGSAGRCCRTRRTNR